MGHIAYRDGWYEWESDDYFPFRWMRAEAAFSLSADAWRSSRYLSIAVSSDMDEGGQTLTIAAGAHVVAELALVPRWHVYDIELPVPPPVGAEESAAVLELTLHVNRLFPESSHPSDSRVLGVRVGPLDLHSDARRHRKVSDFHDWACREWRDETGAIARTAAGDSPARRPGGSGEDGSAAQPEDLFGWHPWVFEDHIPHRWMMQGAAVRVSGQLRRGRRFCTLPVSSIRDDLTQVLTISSGAERLAEFPLLGSWEYYTFPMPDSAAGADIRFSLNDVLPAPVCAGASARPVPEGAGARVGPMEFHDDEARYARARAFVDNAVLNEAEYRAGATVLGSFPLALGIDLYGKCNIKPPCVYCLFDGAKADEGENVNAAVDEQTLSEYGPFFHSARSLVNCSIGEPLLHPRFEQILEFIGRNDKMAEIATNGQAFTPSIVQALAGKRIVLCISLDSASAGTYARLRNDRWDDVMAGLTYLRDARFRANGLPMVHMVFMPMRANLHDLERYFRLCRVVAANALVLRPLNYLENPGIETDRGGYHFDYAAELLDELEIRDVVRRCAGYSEKYGVPVANLFDFGVTHEQASD
jgi:sulfatase maturation enzyme AslB (radical SAM superfamily)